VAAALKGLGISRRQNNLRKFYLLHTKQGPRKVRDVMSVQNKNRPDHNRPLETDHVRNWPFITDHAELSLLAQTDNFTQMKVEAPNRLSGLVPIDSFINFLSWFKGNGRNIGNLIELHFWKDCGLLDDQHICAGVLGPNRYVSWFAYEQSLLSTGLWWMCLFWTGLLS